MVVNCSCLSRFMLNPSNHLLARPAGKGSALLLLANPVSVVAPLSFLRHVRNLVWSDSSSLDVIVLSHCNFRVSSSGVPLPTTTRCVPSSPSGPWTSTTSAAAAGALPATTSAPSAGVPGLLQRPAAPLLPAAAWRVSAPPPPPWKPGWLLLLWFPQRMVKPWYNCLMLNLLSNLSFFSVLVCCLLLEIRGRCRSWFFEIVMRMRSRYNCFMLILSSNSHVYYVLII